MGGRSVAAAAVVLVVAVAVTVWVSSPQVQVDDAVRQEHTSSKSKNISEWLHARMDGGVVLEVYPFFPEFIAPGLSFTNPSVHVFDDRLLVSVRASAKTASPFGGTFWTAYIATGVLSADAVGDAPLAPLVSRLIHHMHRPLHVWHIKSISATWEQPIAIERDGFIDKLSLNVGGGGQAYAVEIVDRHNVVAGTFEATIGTGAASAVDFFPQEPVPVSRALGGYRVRLAVGTVAFTVALARSGPGQKRVYVDGEPDKDGLMLWLEVWMTAAVSCVARAHVPARLEPVRESTAALVSKCMRVLSRSGIRGLADFSTGDEDARLIEWRGEPWLVYNSYDTEKIKRSTVVMADGRLDEPAWCASVPAVRSVFMRPLANTFETPIRLHWERAHPIEKNWGLFEAPHDKNVLLVEYSFDPHVVLRVDDMETGACSLVSETYVSSDFLEDKFHGLDMHLGAPPQHVYVCTDESDELTPMMLSVMHAKTKDQYVNWHFFFDPHPPYAVTRVGTRPLRLPCLQRGEFVFQLVMGATVIDEGRFVVLSYGVDDKRAFVDVVSVRELFAQSEPVPREPPVVPLRSGYVKWPMAFHRVFNPSIVPLGLGEDDGSGDGGGFLAIARQQHFDYVLGDQRRAHGSRVTACRMSTHRRCTDAVSLDLYTPPAELLLSRNSYYDDFIGAEDPRLHVFQGQVLLIYGSNAERNASQSRNVWIVNAASRIPPRVLPPPPALARSSSPLLFENETELDWPEGAQHIEKNWVPFTSADGEALLVSYSLMPRRVVLRVNTSSGRCTIVSDIPATPAITQLAERGSLHINQGSNALLVRLPDQSLAFVAVFHTRPAAGKALIFHNYGVLWAAEPPYDVLRVSTEALRPPIQHVPDIVYISQIAPVHQPAARPPPPLSWASPLIVSVGIDDERAFLWRLDSVSSLFK